MIPDFKSSSVFLGVLAWQPAPLSAQDMTPFVEANIIHTLFHEIGHAIIDQFQLPVIGQEEDAVDAFATIEVMNLYPDAAKPILIDVATSWLHMDAGTDRADLNFYDIHDLDAQRAYRVICHLYGNDPDANADAADWAELPEDTLEICEETGPLAFDSWEVFLADIILADDAPAREVSVSYEPTEYVDEEIALRESRLLDDFAHYAQINFDWPEPLYFVASECGEANAFWDPENLTITLCYEIMKDWSEIEQDIESG